MAAEVIFRCDYCGASKASTPEHFPQGWSTFAIRDASNGSITGSLYLCRDCSELLQAFMKATPQERKGLADFTALRKELAHKVEAIEDLTSSLNRANEENEELNKEKRRNLSRISTLTAENNEMRARLELVGRAAANVRRAARALPAPGKRKTSNTAIIKPEE